MAKLPAFSLLQLNFPYKTAGAGPGLALVKSNKELVKLIGGKLEKSLAAIYPDLDAMNACAIRLTYCLIRSGHTVGVAKGVRTYAGADGFRYTISADEMIAYMKSAFGKPVKIWDGNKGAGKRWLASIKLPTQGIFGYDWQGRTADFGASGHVDIGKLSESGGQQYITEFGTGQYFLPGPMIVYFWECSI